MKLFKKKNVEETVNDEDIIDSLFDEDNKKKKKKTIKIIIIGIVIFIIIGILMTLPNMLFSKDDIAKKNENIDYLVKNYGNDVSIYFLKKRKGLFNYRICSKKTVFCTIVKYNEKKKKWMYPNGESQVNTILFMDQIVEILDNNGIKYVTYSDATVLHDIPNNYVLAVEKDDVLALTRAIISINESGLISSVCSNEECNANYSISIFNKADYEIITSKVKQTDSIKNYADLYEILYKNDDAPYASRLGDNIERHNVGDGMFNCNDEDCNNHKHIAYRYVAGSHNYVDSTIIVEGIN